MNLLMRIVALPMAVPLLIVGIAACLGSGLHAQPACFHFGSHFVPAAVVAAPMTLGCAGAPDWPAWHLLVPAHHEPGPHQGFAPGNATARPCLLVAWRCTGFLLLPVLPWRVTTNGYVIDQPETPCVTS